ncbi:MAG: UvrD-helicase domain-containing protein, partial [Clostridia bacterium]|nr:UvrD-helicase domain-containing protein [Clostridia bacterium]
MSIKWTESQQKAIDTRNSNVIVSAAAGSGKTAVLVQRVIEILSDETNPVRADELIVMTFTNAAAAEMRERIQSALAEKIEKTPENVFLKEQLIVLGQAQISTIHSLCLNLIKDNFHMLNIRHDFEIADESKLSPIRKAAMENVLDNQYKIRDKDFLNT